MRGLNLFLLAGETVSLSALLLLTAAHAAAREIPVWDGQQSQNSTEAPAGNNFVATAAGEYHRLAVREDGSLAAWGFDSFQQVSDAPADGIFTNVSDGNIHRVALGMHGSIVDWGDSL
jgi:alpha-tubulin suppressor-like RCC1 family protein